MPAEAHKVKGNFAKQQIGIIIAYGMSENVAYNASKAAF